MNDYNSVKREMVMLMEWEGWIRKTPGGPKYVLLTMAEDRIKDLTKEFEEIIPYDIGKMKGERDQARILLEKEKEAHGRTLSDTQVWLEKTTELDNEIENLEEKVKEAWDCRIRVMKEARLEKEALEEKIKEQEIMIERLADNLLRVHGISREDIDGFMKSLEEPQGSVEGDDRFCQCNNEKLTDQEQINHTCKTCDKTILFPRPDNKEVNTGPEWFEAHPYNDDCSCRVCHSKRGD